ncbi:c-type cytochrome biogenesis protein CcmI [Oceanobacter kriegii]|uniref:c-type cytochrome biogenesis protein CcmI n=1 Tax=Oceanobacter kriegii TaxID=64972 RepID=UPI000412ABB3|nr:c-type cytochrome biogenesis protein CcmI [Oceanobacter kriegii]
MIWMLLILLVPLALLLLKPSWYKPTEHTQSEENRLLYQERTSELAASDLDEDEKAALQLELDREFLASATQAQNGQSASRGNWMMLGLMLLICVLGSVLLYGFWGADNELRATALLNKGGQVELTAHERAELMERMDTAAARNGDNLEWSYLNARLLIADGQYQQGAEAFKAILAELPEEASADRAATLTLLAEALFYGANQQATDTMYAYLQQSLELNADSRQTLGLAGIMAFELGKHQQAIEHWKALWQGLPAGQESQVLAQGIRRAAAELERQGQTVDLSWLERTGIQVVVDLSPQARAAVQPSDIVFVLAKAVAGPPAPLAVQRLTVAELPVTLTLDDSMAMMPSMTLSSVDEVTLGARVSVSGQPVAQPGDWQIEVSPVPSDTRETIRLTIQNRVQ